MEGCVFHVHILIWHSGEFSVNWVCFFTADTLNLPKSRSAFIRTDSCLPWTKLQVSCLSILKARGQSDNFTVDLEEEWLLANAQWDSTEDDAEGVEQVHRKTGLVLILMLMDQFVSVCKSGITFVYFIVWPYTSLFLSYSGLVKVFVAVIFFQKMRILRTL